MTVRRVLAGATLGLAGETRVIARCVPRQRIHRWRWAADTGSA